MERLSLRLSPESRLSINIITSNLQRQERYDRMVIEEREASLKEMRTLIQDDIDSERSVPDIERNEL